MRIEVHDPRDFGDQTRAYAEYRVFSMLRNFGDIVRHVSVTLTTDDRNGGDGEGVGCRVTITMANGRHLETVAHGRYAYGAIDRVTTRIQSLMARIASGIVSPQPSAEGWV